MRCLNTGGKETGPFRTGAQLVEREGKRERGRERERERKERERGGKERERKKRESVCV